MNCGYFSAEIINRELSAAVVHRLGGKIIKPGQRGQPGGEGYRCRCLFCTDNQPSLYIHHTWGDDINGCRLGPLKCYANECHKRIPDFALRVYRHLFPFPAPSRCSPDLEVNLPPNDLATCHLPPTFRTLAEDPPGHPQITFFRQRGFDPGELSSVWGVGLAGKHNQPVAGLVDALCIPLINSPRESGRNTYVCGFQLHVGQHGNRPIFRTSPDYDFDGLLYGAHLLRELPLQYPAVVVPYPSDAWRYGWGALALLRRMATVSQVEMLAEIARHRPVLLMLGNGFDYESQALSNFLRPRTNYPVKTVLFSASKFRPSYFRRDELRQMASAALSSKQDLTYV